MTIRAATLDDLATLVRLRIALLLAHRDHPVYGRLRPDAVARAERVFAVQLASDAEVTLLAIIDGEAIGILRCVDAAGSPLLAPSRYAYVSSVYVEPRARRRGVLRALVSAADTWCAGRGLDEMRLHNAAGSDEANAAWDALGFGIVEVMRTRALRHD